MMVRRQTLSGLVADSILRQIREGEIKPGDRLPTLKELAEHHDVGYGVAREAMQQLVALGLVDVRPRRGAIVRDLDVDGALEDARLALVLSDQDAGELYDLRLLVEVANAGRAAQFASQEQIDDILAAQRAFDAALKGNRQVHDVDIELHAAVARAGGNAVFIRVLGVLRGVLAGVRAEASRVPRASEVAAEEHQAIVDAIIARDPVAASEAMRRHIETAKKTMLLSRRRDAPTEKESVSSR